MADEAFEELYTQSFAGMKNVTICWEPEPTPEQTAAVAPPALLCGLFEGLPYTIRSLEFSVRSANVGPPKITLFKKNLEAVCRTRRELKDRIKNTLWHEAAHYFGLDHTRIHELEADHAHG